MGQIARERRYNTKDDPAELTAREVEVLRHLVYRWSDREIADDLRVSVHTVKYHKKNIYQKWGVKRRADAIAVFHSKMQSSSGDIPQILGFQNFSNYWIWYAGESSMLANNERAR